MKRRSSDGSPSPARQAKRFKPQKTDQEKRFKHLVSSNFSTDKDSRMCDGFCLATFYRLQNMFAALTVLKNMMNKVYKASDTQDFEAHLWELYDERHELAELSNPMSRLKRSFLESDCHRKGVALAKTMKELERSTNLMSRLGAEMLVQKKRNTKLLQDLKKTKKH